VRIVPRDSRADAKPVVSSTVRWKLLDRLYASNSIAGLAALQILLTGLLLCMRMAVFWPLLWAAISLAIFTARIRIAVRYRDCSEDDDPELWAKRFIYAAWLASSLWGGLGVLIVLVPDPLVHAIVIGTQWTHLNSIFTRNSCEPRAAYGQVLLVSVPLAVACLATFDSVYMLYGVLVLVRLVVARETIQALYVQVLELLNANEELAASRDDLEQANAQLEALATTDALTNLVNRRGFDVAMRREWRRGLRSFQPISLVLLDLDHFKRLNDALGHPAGDSCLRQVGESIAKAIRRPGDVAARYGGEEFAVVLPDTDAVAARMMAERIRAAIADLRIPHPGSPIGTVTVSVGAATSIPDEFQTSAQLIQQADMALYRAKASGRNCIILAPSVPVPADQVSPGLVPLLKLGTR
jgi:diguanylate cyclase (GGDEF)-like protein